MRINCINNLELYRTVSRVSHIHNSNKDKMRVEMHNSLETSNIRLIQSHYAKLYSMPHPNVNRIYALKAYNKGLK